MSRPFLCALCSALKFFSFESFFFVFLVVSLFCVFSGGEKSFAAAKSFFSSDFTAEVHSARTHTHTHEHAVH